MSFEFDSKPKTGRTVNNTGPKGRNAIATSVRAWIRGCQKRMSAKGAAQRMIDDIAWHKVSALRASRLIKIRDHALTDVAIACRPFGPNISHETSALPALQANCAL